MTEAALTEATPTAGAAGRARAAITTVFALNGALIASLAVRTPSLKADLGLSAGQLGLTTALMGVAAVLTMQYAGALTRRVGSARIVRPATVLLPLVLIGVGLARGPVALYAVMVALGAVHGLLDVTMNAHAVAVERVLGRPIMNGCHAAWSIGAVLGSLAGGAAAQVGAARSGHYVVVAVVLVGGALTVGRWLLPASVDRRRTAEATGRAAGTGWLAGWSRRLLIFGAMGATVLTCEAAVATWGGVLLHENLHATLGVAALGYIAFTGCETAGRLLGDRLFARYAAAALIRVGAVIAGSGLTLVVLSRWPAATIAGFAVLGLGLATPLPVLFSVVGHLGADGPGAAALVARFSTMTYSGILLAPAVIGWFAQAVGLYWTLAALIPLLAFVAWQARAATAVQPERGEFPAEPVHPAGARSS